MIDIDGQHEWRDCLDIPGVRLPQGFYFGASAITGDLSGKQLPLSHETLQPIYSLVRAIIVFQFIICR